MRTASMSNLKKSSKKSIDNRTTKTKASAKKPDLFEISLARNKNNPNPILFNSVKKKIGEPHERSNNLEYQSQRKNNAKNENNNLFEQLNMRISIDYINSLYSDLAIQFGYQLRNQMQNKENIISERNVNVSLPLKQQKQCFDKIKSLIELRDQVNRSYNCMKNTRNLFSYLVKKNQTEQNDHKLSKENNSIQVVNQSISDFLKHYQSKQLQLQSLEKQYHAFVSKNQQEEQISENADQEQLDSIIQNLKEQIAQEKKICLRYQKQQKFLINKLYFTQKKNNDLRTSSTNLKIKNINLRDTIRLSPSGKKTHSPKPQRSFSLKLQRVKKYNLDEQPILFDTNLGSEKPLIRSKSTSSLNSARRASYMPIKQKQTFFDRIY